jgi:hypothetical protein
MLASLSLSLRLTLCAWGSVSTYADLLEGPAKDDVAQFFIGGFRVHLAKVHSTLRRHARRQGHCLQPTRVRQAPVHHHHPDPELPHAPWAH